MALRARGRLLVHRKVPNDHARVGSPAGRHGLSREADGWVDSAPHEGAARPGCQQWVARRVWREGCDGDGEVLREEEEGEGEGEGDSEGHGRYRRLRLSSKAWMIKGQCFV